MTDVEKKTLGRPRKYQGTRPTWTVRLEPALGAEIKAMAESTGRSISEVCERQISDSFRLQTEVAELKAENAQLRRSNEASEDRIYNLLEKVNAGYQNAHQFREQLANLTTMIQALTEKK